MTNEETIVLQEALAALSQGLSSLKTVSKFSHVAMIITIAEYLVSLVSSSLPVVPPAA